MSITVKFFASLKEQFDDSEIVIELDSASTTVADIWQRVSADKPVPESVLSAVNLEYAQPEQQLNDGDEVAFFPPVTGG